MCTVWMWDFEVHDDIGLNGYCDDPNLPVKKQPSLEVHVEKELSDGANSAVSHFSFSTYSNFIFCVYWNKILFSRGKLLKLFLINFLAKSGNSKHFFFVFFKKT
jgi:hypothetical protein